MALLIAESTGSQKEYDMVSGAIKSLSTVAHVGSTQVDAYGACCSAKTIETPGGHASAR